MHGVVEPPARKLTEESFRENEDFLYGIDLFNAGYYWEAHTFWERLWRVEGTVPAVRSLLRALIQLAAACLKRRQGRIDGAGKLLRRARRNASRGVVMGVDLDALDRAVGRFVEGAEEAPVIEVPE